MLVFIRMSVYLFYHKRCIDSELAMLLKIKACHINADF